MHATALTRALTAVVALGLGAALATVTPAYADNVDPAAPVVVNDTVSLYPLQSREINVLANDTDPAGDDLALCRFPAPDYTAAVPSGMVTDESGFGAPVGTLDVLAMPRAKGTTTIDYYVCNHTRLTPATLTIDMLPVAPVDVATVPHHPGRLSVTNNNERQISFWFGDPRAARPDGKTPVAAHATRMVRVQRTSIFWIAVIGHQGLADHGRVRDIKLDGPALPAPHRHHAGGSSGSGSGTKAGSMRSALATAPGLRWLR